MAVNKERALRVTFGREALPWTVEIWGALAGVEREGNHRRTPRSSKQGCSAARIIAKASCFGQFEVMEVAELSGEGYIVAFWQC
jgi:hypothetical protein